LNPVFVSESRRKPYVLLFLNILINVLQNIKQVSLEKIATALPLPILFERRRKNLFLIFIIA